MVPEKPPLISSRIALLEQALLAGNTASLDIFWQEVVEHGTPLIEPIEGDETHSLVTFLWRGSEDTKNVVVFAGPAGWEEPAKNQMTRMLGTDLWYRTYRVRSNLRTVYLLSSNYPLSEPINGEADLGTLIVPDTLNPRRFVYPKDKEASDSKEVVVSILELPDAPPQPWIAPRRAVAKGHVEIYHRQSPILANERRVYIYTPPDYAPNNKPYPLLLLFDGSAYIDLVPTPTILDNLISEGKIPPLVAVLPDSLDQDTRNRELPCHQPFVDFLTQELLPWVHEHYSVTNDPAQTVVAGSSYGGLAAAFVGLHASETFGNVLSQSGAFWWDRDPEDKIPGELLIQQFIASPHLPLRFYIEVGLQEKGGMVNLVSCNRHMRDVLQLKGYEVHYNEFNGGHDYICWRGSLADGLMTLASEH